jgi:hypothetical protein
LRYLHLRSGGSQDFTAREHILLVYFRTTIKIV